MSVARADAPLLAVHGLRRRFGGITAADGVELDVRHGEIVGIIGPNGSGKSTLFNLVSGAIPPEAGQILLDGTDIAGWKPHRIARAGIARTFQIPALFVNMSVLDNLLAAAAEDRWDGAYARAEDVIRLLRLEAVRDNRAADLSGGQQKLVEFGRVAMRQARLVLLDEVTAGVHPNIRRIILDAVDRLRGEGTTFLLIEHDMELVGSVCDRIVVMDAGRVVATGTFDEIVQNAEVVQAYLGRRS